ncbi:MAG: hypothetical protein Q8S18_01160 [Bacteroidales bacterium]|nr:hypothetical protein [Bacteroidales bacterium]
MAVVLSIGLVSAQNEVKTEKTTTTQNGPAYADKDHNGVCDNFENGTPGNPNANGKQRLRDGSGSGKGQGFGMRNGQRNGHNKGGRNFTDADKNGVCDSYENRTTGQGRGPGKGTGLRNGKGRAANFVDTNNNGICDRREVSK